MSVGIRRATPADAEELTDVAFAAKRCWDYPESWIELWAGELRVDPDYVTSHRVFVASDGKRILGWTAVAKDDGELWLDYCWVFAGPASDHRCPRGGTCRCWRRPFRYSDRMNRPFEMSLTTMFPDGK